MPLDGGYQGDSYHDNITTINMGTEFSSSTYVSTPVPKYGTFDEAILDTAKEIAEMACRKQHDYGTHNILDSPLGAERGILVRLWDKFCRLRNLVLNDKSPKNESKTDTYRDIIGYCLVAIMVDEGWFTLPLKGETNQ